ncbi:MAG TPA: glycosyltransferase, partial [Actinomycetes bacterium]|nr:glycosyltransferase [Actinomycetes bacterium]
MTSPSADTVAVVTSAEKLGGAERSLVALARELPAAGVHPVIIAPRGEVINAAIAAGICVRELPLSGGLPISRSRSGRKHYPILNAAMIIAAKCRDAIRLSKVIIDVKPGVVHSNNLPSHFPVIIAGTFSGTPVTLHLREIIAPGPGRALLAILTRMASAVVAISPAVAASVSSGRVVTVLNPVPGPAASVEPLDWPRPALPVIGYLGRIDQRKGVHDVVRLAHEFPSLVRVVGDLDAASPDYRRQLRELADRAFPGRVEFAGMTDDPYAALAGFDVLVVPSRQEPFGRVAAEAQRLGVPVVAADRAGLLAVVTDGVSGLTYPPGDIE